MVQLYSVVIRIVLLKFLLTFQDLPSFTRGVHRFVSDVRYYRLYNSSLPSGTVTF